MGNIISLTKLKRNLRPYSATLVAGFFDLFHVGHLRYLKKCSKVGRPLIVGVLSDRATKIIKGLNRPIIRERERAEIIAALEFVDYVLILENPSYRDNYLKVIKPRYFIFSKELMKYRRYRARLIKEKFPRTKIIFLNKTVPRFSTSLICEKIINSVQKKRNYSKIKNPIIRRLYFLADKSKASVGKVSAIITYCGRNVAESSNIEDKELHAERIVIEKAKKKDVNLKKSKLYTFILPCIMCVRDILDSQIKEVYYLNNFGNNDGVELLKKHKIQVKKLRTF